MRRLPVPTKAIALLLAAAFVLLAGSRSAGDEKKQTPPKGLRVFSCGHSFHYFVPPLLTEVAKGAGIKDHKAAGLSAQQPVWVEWCCFPSLSRTTYTSHLLPSGSVAHTLFWTA